MRSVRIILTIFLFIISLWRPISVQAWEDCPDNECNCDEVCNCGCGTGKRCGWKLDADCPDGQYLGCITDSNCNVQIIIPSPTIMDGKN